MKVSIITIGDEILIGQIIDTNSAWIAQRLNEIGLRVEKIYSISAVQNQLHRSLTMAISVHARWYAFFANGPERYSRA